MDGVDLEIISNSEYLLMIKDVLGISQDRNTNDWGKINHETGIFTWPEEAEDDSQIEADSDDNLFIAGGD